MRSKRPSRESREKPLQTASPRGVPVTPQTPRGRACRTDHEVRLDTAWVKRSRQRPTLSLATSCSDSSDGTWNAGVDRDVADYRLHTRPRELHRRILQRYHCKVLCTTFGRPRQRLTLDIERASANVLQRRFPSKLLVAPRCPSVRQRIETLFASSDRQNGIKLHDRFVKKQRCSWRCSFSYREHSLKRGVRSRSTSQR